MREQQVTKEEKMANLAKLRIHVSRGGSIQEIKNYLTDLQYAYENLYAMEIIISDLRTKDQEYRIPFEPINNVMEN